MVIIGIQDFIQAPLIILLYGSVFSVIPFFIVYLSAAMNSTLVILPMMVTLALIAPIFATGLYDVAWELEKGHTPSFRHSLLSMFRNLMADHLPLYCR